MKFFSDFFSKILIFWHRTLSSALPGACRFEPSCSLYAAEALKTHGLLGGAWLALRRLSRCHPWGSHGYDPVPLTLKLTRTKEGHS